MSTKTRNIKKPNESYFAFLFPTEYAEIPCHWAGTFTDRKALLKAMEAATSQTERERSSPFITNVDTPREGAIVSDVAPDKKLRLEILWKAACDAVVQQCRSYVEHSPPQLLQDCLSSLRTDLNHIRGTASPLQEVLHHTTAQTCFLCLLEFPTEQLTCGHSLCYPCAQFVSISSRRISCPFCSTELDWHPVAIPLHAGRRILALDGGGIRGSVHATVLHMLSEDTGLAPVDMFDFIAGTSAGGIAAAILTSRQAPSSNDLMKTSEKLSKGAFSYSVWRAATSFITSAVKLGTYHQYDPIALQGQLEKVFEEDYASINPLTVTGIRPPLIAITSVEVTGGVAVPCLFLNYNRKPRKGLLPVIRGATRLEASMATSAAPTIFPPFSMASGQRFIDGGMKWNCPLRIALDESNAAFDGKAKIDLVLSVGTGLHVSRGDAEQPHISLLQYAKICVNLLADSQALYLEAINSLSDADRERVVRLNPPLDREIGLDSINQDDLQHLSIKTWQLHAHPSYEKIRDQIVASLFYFDRVVDRTKGRVLRGSLACRLPSLPAKLLEYLGVPSDSGCAASSSREEIISKHLMSKLNVQVEPACKGTRIFMNKNHRVELSIDLDSLQPSSVTIGITLNLRSQCHISGSPFVDAAWGADPA